MCMHENEIDDNKIFEFATSSHPLPSTSWIELSNQRADHVFANSSPFIRGLGLVVPTPPNHVAQSDAATHAKEGDHRNLLHPGGGWLLARRQTFLILMFQAMLFGLFN